MKKLKLKITISHNEVTESYSVMSEPSTMLVELSEEKTMVWNSVGNTSILNTWAQNIWELTHPNTYGKIINVQIVK